MTTIKLIRKILILLIAAFAVCLIPSCGDSADYEPNNNSNNNNNNNYDDDDDDDDDDNRRECNKCFGDGICAVCGGDGVCYDIIADYYTCPSCGGDGICNRCDGTGKR